MTMAISWVSLCPPSLSKTCNTRTRSSRLDPISSQTWASPTVKISKVGEVMWAKGLNQQASNYNDTGITSLAYLNDVLYAAGKRNWSSGSPGATVRPHSYA